LAVTSYPFRGKIEGSDFTIDEVISSLASQKILIQQAVQVLEGLDPNYDPQKLVIRVISVQQGSLLWDILVEIWGVYQKDLIEGVTGSIEDATGLDIPDAYEPLVAIAVMAVVYWGLRYAYDRVSKRKEKASGLKQEPAIHIEGNYNTVIQLVAERIEAEPQRVERVLDETLMSDRTKVAKAAVDFVRPARRRGTSIKVANAPEVTAEVLGEVPSETDLNRTADQVFTSLEDATIQIRGTDRDSLHAGWRGLIEGDDRFPKRLPIHLSPTINPEELANIPRIQAAATVEGEQFFDGSYVPRRIHLHAYRAATD